MAFSYIDKKNFGDAYKEAESYMRPVFEPLSEFERIARNLPKPNLPAGIPKTTDGTTASFVSSRSKSVIQQLPNGIITSLDKDKELAGVADLVLSNEIIPNANSTGSVLQKSWAALSKALTYGSQPGFIFYTKRGDYYGADFKLPYIKDVYFEKGRIYDKDCNVIFMRSWYQKSDVKAIINKAKEISKNNIKTGWNVKLLSSILNKTKAKDDESKTPAEREQNIDAGGIEVIFGFQSGVGSKFYGYSPDLKEIIYEIVNPDPRGVIPIHYLYCDLDMSNPIGRGSVELTAGLQNMLDAEVQMYQYTQALGLAPPIIKRGTFNTSNIRFKPNAIWDLGENPNNRIDTVNISTTALNNFPSNYGLIKSQMLNINNANDTSVSAEIGNPGFSKTDSGVKAQQERVGITDNHLAKQYESWFGDVCETMLNIHFALSTGDREIELTEQYINHRRLEEPEFSGKSATVHYDEVKTGFKFDVNFSTSKVKQDSEAVENLKGLLDLRKQYPELAEYVRVDKVFDRLVTKIGIEDPEELIVKPDESIIDEQEMSTGNEPEVLYEED